MARQHKELNWDLVEKRIEAGNTAQQIADAHYININTFCRKFEERYECKFGDYKEKFYSLGNANLQLTQYIKALGGNIPMLILLGRERLGQGKIDERTPANDDLNELIHINMMLRAQIDKLQGKNEAI